MNKRNSAFQIFNALEKLDTVPDVVLSGTEVTGKALFCSEEIAPGCGHMGVDRLDLKSNEKFPLHTHPGHHILYVLSGFGTVTIEDTVYTTIPGDVYLINGNVPHAVSAGERGQSLLSFGVPHKHLDSPDRMKMAMLPMPARKNV